MYKCYYNSWVRNTWSSIGMLFILAGPEKQKDLKDPSEEIDSGKGTITSYGSINSLSSSSSYTVVPSDNPEHIEVMKQLKEIRENGNDL